MITFAVATEATVKRTCRRVKYISLCRFPVFNGAKDPHDRVQNLKFGTNNIWHEYFAKVDHFGVCTRVRAYVWVSVRACKHVSISVYV